MRDVLGACTLHGNVILSPCSSMWDDIDESIEARDREEVLTAASSRGGLDDFLSFKPLIRMQRLPVKEPAVLSVMFQTPNALSRSSLGECLERSLRLIENQPGIPADIRIYATVAETPFIDGGMNIVFDTRSHCPDRSRWVGRFLQPRMLLGAPGEVCDIIAKHVPGATAAHLNVKTRAGESVVFCHLPESALRMQAALNPVKDHFAVIVAEGNRTPDMRQPIADQASATGKTVDSAPAS